MDPQHVLDWIGFERKKERKKRKKERASHIKLEKWSKLKKAISE